jgi:hypothetical protein
MKESKKEHSLHYVLAPADFDPRKATDPELIKHGYPPRPKGDANPKLQALWERLIKRRFRIITPHLTKTESVHPPKIQGVNADNTTISGWAGATNTSLPSDWSFNFVCAEWTVPNATIYWANEVADGPHDINACIGLAGTFTGTPSFPGSYPMIALSTMSRCVVSNGVVQPGSQTAYAWFSSWSEGFIVNVPVHPGDKVGASMYGIASGSAPLTTTTFQFWNFTQGLYTSFNWNPPEFRATICQWLVGAEPYLVDENLPSPYPLTTGLVYSNTLAIGINAEQTESTEVDLTSATLLNMVQPGGGEAITVELGPESFEIEECCIL